LTRDARAATLAPRAQESAPAHERTEGEEKAMPKRLVLLWLPLVLGLALMLPATTFAAGPATYFVVKNTCSNSGGSQGWGKSVIQVEQDENGKSGVTRFRQRAWAQMHYGGKWHVVNTFSWQYSPSFPNTSANHVFTFKFIEHWASDHYYYAGRLKWRGEWLNNSGNVLFYQNLFSTAC
jgi:hypothetical protein